jgi:hypothetical protein
MLLPRNPKEHNINIRISGKHFTLIIHISHCTRRVPEASLMETVTGSQPSSIFQVVTGGQYDVDVTLEAPNKEIIYRQTKSQFDSYNFVPKMTGVYVVCFSNEFSTFSHKLVYMDFQVGDEQPLPGLGEHVTVMTQVST